MSRTPSTPKLIKRKDGRAMINLRLADGSYKVVCRGTFGTEETEQRYCQTAAARFGAAPAGHR